MIDYQKLQLAHELAEKLDQRVSIEVCFFRFGTQRYTFNADNFNDSFSDNNLDDFIAKLQELTAPKPKYESGTTVWRINDEDRPVDVYLKKSELNKYQEVYFDGEDWWDVGQLYPTRQVLIEAQIEYWTSLKNEENSTCSDDVSMTPTFKGAIVGFNKEECQHESDGGEFTYHDQGDEQTMSRCKKCGEFYR
jgi:hypothetical protein